jgi:branched-chain amino acid transport system permease protein
VSVVNFAVAGIGTFGAFVTSVLYERHVAFMPALLAGVVAGAALAALFGMLMSFWFGSSSPATRTSVSIAFLVGLVAIGLRAFGSHPRPFPETLEGSVVTISGVVITWAAVVTTALAVVLAAAVTFYLRRTRTGLRLRALSERPVTAEIIGVHVRRLSIGLWTASGAIATVAIIVAAPEQGHDFQTLSLLIIPAFAAALVGAWNSLGAAAAGGILLGMLQGAASQINGIQEYREVVPFVIILVILLWSQRGARWDDAR